MLQSWRGGSAVFRAGPRPRQRGPSYLESIPQAEEGTKSADRGRLLAPKNKFGESHLNTRDPEADMQLRDWLEPNWPPAWATSGTGKIATGEDGLLVGVRLRQEPHGQEMLVLEIDYGGRRQTGALVVPDPMRRVRALSILRENIGRPIREIGSLEVK